MNNSAFAQGGCYCGAVRYTMMTAPEFSFLCHCESCQKMNGGMRLAGMSLPGSQWSVEGPLTEYRYEGGKGTIVLWFCSTCGTPVYANPTVYGDNVVVRAGTLDDRNLFRPMKSIFTRAVCSWDLLLKGE